jgi:hypothetical protein
LWAAYVDLCGYGRFRVGGKYGTMATAHRLAYRKLVGEISDGLQVDHLCRVRCCVNPNHMEAVSQQENMRRGVVGKHNRAKTHCPRGHEYTPENTYIRKKMRHCKACCRLKARKRRTRAVDRLHQTSGCSGVESCNARGSSGEAS